MRIRITKRDGKPALLACLRADGSSTLGEIAPGPAHDLAHYVVETSLGLRNAFFGLVAGGMDLRDFNVPGAVQRLQLPDEAVYAEFVIGVLQVERLHDSPAADFQAELDRALAGARRPPPVRGRIDVQVADRMRTVYCELLERWAKLPVGGTIELEFPEQSNPDPKREQAGA